MINVGTFGSSKAEIYLNDVLIKLSDEHLSHKVCAIYNKYKTCLKYIRDIKDKGFRVYVLQEWLDKNVAKCRNPDFPELVRTLLENCVRTKHKIEIAKIREK